MPTRIEPGLELVEAQPPCIAVTFIDAARQPFDIAADNRGQAFVFERLDSPAVFIEVIQTRAGNVRGNHVHQHCTETLQVIAGNVTLYLLCEHQKHVFGRNMKQGDAVIIRKGTAHALYSTDDSSCVVFFDQDPRNDRARVPVLQF